MGLKVAFTIFTSAEGKSICKKAELGADGEINIKADGLFYNGKFETVVCEWREFGSILQGLGLNQFLCLGTSNMVDGKSGRLITSGICGGGPGEVRRTNENFSWNAKAHGADANIVLLDVDVVPDDIAAKGLAGLEDLVERVVEDVEELDKVGSGFFAWPSAGAFIYKVVGNDENAGAATGGRVLLRGFSGAHIYFPLPAVEGRTPELFKEYLKWSLICKEKFWIKENANASLRVKTYIDSSAIGQSRADYIAGSDCGDGSVLVQDRGKVLWIESDGRDDFVLGETGNGGWSRARGAVLVEKAKTVYRLDEGYRARLEAVAAREAAASGGKLSKREALESLKALEHGVIKGSRLILVKKSGGGGVGAGAVWEPTPAWKMLLDPDRFDGATVGDPRDDGMKSGGPGTAMDGKCRFYANSGGQFAGRPKLHGFVTGEAVFDIQMDLPAVRDMLDGLGSVAAAEEKYGVDWWRLIGESNLISAAERETIMQELCAKWFNGHSGGGVRRDLLEKIRSAVIAVDKKRSGESLKDKIDSYNAKYACVRSGDDVRIFWEEFEEEHFGSVVTVEMSKQGFFDWMKTDTVTDIDSKGKPITVEVAKAWWANKDRKQYKGTIFAPWTKEKEVNGKLNMFKGWSVDAVGVGRRECEGKGCGGKGCLAWFLNDARGMKAIDIEHDSGAKAEDGVWRSWGCGSNKINGRWVGCIWWLRHLYENICSRQLDQFIWGLDWFADIFQNPERKPGTVFAMRGGQGVGKGLLVKPIEAILRKHFYQCRSPRELTGQFNAHLENLLLVFSDEAFWAGNPEAGSIWKALVTEQTLGIERKFRDMAVSKSYLRACLATNDAWAVMVERDDRRHFCLDVSDRYQNRDIFGNDKGLGDYWTAVVATDPGALLSELLDRNIESNVRVPPVTKGLKAQKAQSMGAGAKLISVLLESYPQAFNEFGIANTTLFYIAKKEGCGDRYLRQKALSHELKRLLVDTGCAEEVKNLMSGKHWRPIDGEPKVEKGRGFRIDREKTEKLMLDLFGED